MKRSVQTGSESQNTVYLNKHVEPAEQAIADQIGAEHGKTFSGSAESLSEVAQAKIRNWMHFALLLFAIIALQFGADIDVSKLIITTFTAIPAGFALHFWALQLNKKRATTNWRVAQRAASMVIDNAFISWVLHFGGVTFAGMCALYIWISVGYGIRYGTKYLYAAVAIATVMFNIAAWYTPFWHQNPGLVAGMLFGLLIVPAYVGWLITQLQKAVAEKDLAYRAKSDFVAMMSHELRTPLHGIISTSELLRGTASSPKQKEMIRIISTSSNTLLELINRVLDISKFESNSIKLQRQPMDLHAVVNDAANILWPQVLEKGLSLQIYIDPEINNSLIGSPHQLQEVLINLLGNAVKFTDSGNVAARVLFKGESEDTVSVRFEISDTGPGIPKHALANIFEPFAQADSPTTRKHGGTGLGTAFAKELIRLMGGNIAVDSTEGVGTKFTIDVALQKLREREEVASLYPFTVAGIGFDSTQQGLSSALAQFGTKVVFFDDVTAFSDYFGTDSNDSYPEAIFVEADTFADNLGGVVRSVGIAITDRITPMFACGSELFRASAIAAGYSAFVPRIDDAQLIGRTLNMISALRHDAPGELLPAASSSKGLHILVAEDNTTNQRIAQMVLEEVGHRCTIVGNGDEALDALHEGNFDLAILDMHMPQRDGMEVAKIYNFSHFEKDERIPLIMMTADGRIEARNEATASGIDEFVTKPISPRQLIDVINSVASKYHVEGSFSVEHELADDDLPGDATVTDLVTGRSANTCESTLNKDTFDELLTYMESNEREEFFEDFITDGAQYIATLEASSDDSSAALTRDEMHAFAGACLVIGADRLAAKAREIELLESDVLLANRAKLHDEILALFNETVTEVRALYRG
jgi:two-component system sensor histidine kinase RpfC